VTTHAHGRKTRPVTTTLATLRARFAALPDPADVPTTARAQAEAGALRSRLAGQIATAEVAQRTLAEYQPKIAADESYLATLDQMRERLQAERLRWLTPKTDLARGHLENVQRSLTAVDIGTAGLDGTGWCLDTLRLGKLLGEAGVAWRGGRDDAVRRLRDARTRVDDAQQQLTEALLTDAEREKRDSAAATRAAKENARSREEKKAAHNAARQARGFGVMAPDAP